MAIEVDNTWWLEVVEVMRLEGISRMEGYRRMKPGDAHPLIWKDRREIDGKPGRVIYWKSLSFNGQARWREERLKQASGQWREASSACHQPAATTLAAPVNASDSSRQDGSATDSSRQDGGATPAQPKLWPQTVIDEQISAIDLPEPQRSIAIRRFRIVQPLLNHDYRSRGCETRSIYVREQAKQIHASQSTIFRWADKLRKTISITFPFGDINTLGNERRGPATTGVGSGSPGKKPTIDSLGSDGSLAGFIYLRSVDGYTPAQIYRDSIQYLKDKQRGCGEAWVYEIPSEATVRRYIKSLDALKQAERQGPDAVKAALGYLDRTYRDLDSLGAVEVDETKINVLGYHENKRGRVMRFWIVTLYDQRSLYPLVWDLIGAPDQAKTMHGITQRDELRLFESLVRGYGLPGRIHSDRGRFRGNFWGHEKKSRNAEFQGADGILEQLGVGRNKPREKNPRGVRLERFHGFLRDKARGMPGWIGMDDNERAMTRGDAEAAEHLEYCQGRQTSTPLLSRGQLLATLDEWMEEWRSHLSAGTDMDGLSPRAMFLQNTPAGGFRQPTPPELSIIDSEVFMNVKILPGGIIQLHDGSRYGLPGEIMLEQGQKRTVMRQRSDLSVIKVLPLKKGQPKLEAHLRPRVGTSDVDALARAQEMQMRLRKLAQQFGPHGAPGEASILPADQPPAGSQVINPAEFCHPETGSLEWFETHRHRGSLTSEERARRMREIEEGA